VIAPFYEIASIVREVLHDRDLDIALTTRFDDLPDWDSMDLVSVVVEIECRFDVQFELVEIERITTIGDLVQMLEAKQTLTAA